LKGEFNDTAAGHAMGEALPIECQWSRWGEEYYGTTRPAFPSYPGTATDLMEAGIWLTMRQTVGFACFSDRPRPAAARNPGRRCLCRRLAA
jgi:hypothetical protein